LFIIGVSFVAIACLIISNIYAQEQTIPKWIKGVAKFWVEGEVNDQEFIQALQWMIDNGILRVSPQTELEKQLEQKMLEEALKKWDETPPLIGIDFRCEFVDLDDDSFYTVEQQDFTVEVMNHDTKPHSPIIEIQSVDEYDRPIYTSLIEVGELEPNEIKTVNGSTKASEIVSDCNAVVKEVN